MHIHLISNKKKIRNYFEVDCFAPSVDLNVVLFVYFDDSACFSIFYTFTEWQSLKMISLLFL